MGKYKSKVQALAPMAIDVPRGEAEAAHYRLGFNQARAFAVKIAEDADFWIGCVAKEGDMLRKERDDLRAAVKELHERSEGLAAERDEAIAKAGPIIELARLRSLIRQMVRDEAERKIEALGVGEDGGSELVYVRPRFGKQRCECRLQAGDSPCPVHVQRENIDAGEVDNG